MDESSRLAGGFFGSGLSGAGDVNGDGFCDLLVGEPYAPSGGAAYLIEGGSAGVGSTVAATIAAAPMEQSLGQSIDGAGDVNGDGYADVIIGAPYSGPGTRVGAADLYFGTSSGLATASRVHVTSTFGDFGMFGAGVAGVGDIDGDGNDDVVIGAPGAMTNRGAATIIYGSNPFTLTRTDGLVGPSTIAGQFGAPIVGAGDVNNDGFADVFASAYSLSVGGVPGVGAAYLFTGNSPSINTAAISTLTGPSGSPGAGFGLSLGGRE